MFDNLSQCLLRWEIEECFSLLGESQLFERPDKYQVKFPLCSDWGPHLQYRSGTIFWGDMKFVCSQLYPATINTFPGNMFLFCFQRSIFMPMFLKYGNLGCLVHFTIFCSICVVMFNLQSFQWRAERQPFKQLISAMNQWTNLNYQFISPPLKTAQQRLSLWNFNMSFILHNCWLGGGVDMRCKIVNWIMVLATHTFPSMWRTNSWNDSNRCEQQQKNYPMRFYDICSLVCNLFKILPNCQSGQVFIRFNLALRCP